MISLPLAKLSTAQDVWPDEQTFQWKHETNNLTCVVDSYQTGGSALQLLKVVQGTQIRQQIEVERLVKESHDLVSDMQHRGIELKGEQLPISAIVRCPLLAIRWQLPDQKVRRLQMRFRSNEDFDLVYNHLQRLGLRMIPPQGQSKDRTAKLEHSGPGLPPPSSPSRPVTDRAGPSCPPSRLLEISSRPFTAVSAPTALESHIQESAHARPSSAFAGSVFSSSNPLSPPVHFARPDSAAVVSPEYLPSFPPRERPITSVEHHDGSTPRPDTALLYERPDTADLPPRRELPFQRDSLPTSSGSDQNRPHSRPSTGFMGPPPLPSRVSDLRPGSARAAGSDSELPPLRQPTIIADNTRNPPSQQRPLTPRPSSKGHTRSEQAMSVYEDQNFSRASSSPQAYTSVAASPTAARSLSPISSTAQNRRSFAPPSPAASPSASRSKDQMNRAHGSNFSGDADIALNAYAMQSGDVRTSALNEFILKNLDNDDFLTLVEDVEINWARLGLGTW